MQWRWWDRQNSAAVKFIYFCHRIGSPSEAQSPQDKVDKAWPRAARSPRPPQVTHPSSHFKSYKIPPIVTNIRLLDWKFWTSIFFSQKKKSQHIRSDSNLIYHKFPSVSEQRSYFSIQSIFVIWIFFSFLFHLHWFILRPKPPHKLLFVKWLQIPKASISGLAFVSILISFSFKENNKFCC